MHRTASRLTAKLELGTKVAWLFAQVVPEQSIEVWIWSRCVTNFSSETLC